MMEGRSRRYFDDGLLETSQNVLDALRQEFIEVVDEIAEDSVTAAHRRLFDEVQEHLKLLNTASRRDQPELSFFKRKIRDHQASNTLLALKKKL